MAPLPRRGRLRPVRLASCQDGCPLRLDPPVVLPDAEPRTSAHPTPPAERPQGNALAPQDLRTTVQRPPWTRRAALRASIQVEGRRRRAVFRDGSAIHRAEPCG